jgi:hypothetical protein
MKLLTGLNYPRYLMTEWIKCSERLPPKDLEDYVCLTDKGELTLDIISPCTNGTRKFAGEWQEQYEITHWCELPEFPQEWLDL